MLDQRKEGVAGVVDVQPVDVGQPAVEAEDQAVGAEPVAPVVAGQPVGRQALGQAGEEAGWQRGQDLVEALDRSIGLDAHGAVRLGTDRADLLAEPDLAAALADQLGQPLVEELEAAAEVAKLRRAAEDARPEPGHRDLVVEVVELGAQERLPDHPRDPRPHDPADPALGGRRLEAVVVLLQLQVGQRHAHAQAVGRRQRREAQDRDGVVELVDALAG